MDIRILTVIVGIMDLTIMGLGVAFLMHLHDH